jgi:hypothetical protein
MSVAEMGREISMPANSIKARRPGPQAVVLAFISGGTLEEGLGKLECDGRAAQVFAGILAPVLVGIEHSERSRRAVQLVGQVMVCDDEIKAEPRGLQCSRVCTDARINRDDQPDALSGCVRYA